MPANDTENKQKKDDENGLSKPDPETTKTTDPQEHMEGPVSSLMQKAEEGFEDEEKTPKNDG